MYIIHGNNHCVFRERAFHLHVFQAVKWLVHDIIVPFNGRDFIGGADGGQGIDHMRAEEWINIVWGEPPFTWSVLGPVCNVAHQFWRGH